MFSDTFQNIKFFLQFQIFLWIYLKSLIIYEMITKEIKLIFFIYFVIKVDTIIWYDQWYEKIESNTTDDM